MFFFQKRHTIDGHSSNSEEPGMHQEQPGINQEQHENEELEEISADDDALFHTAYNNVAIKVVKSEDAKHTIKDYLALRETKRDITWG